MDKKHLNTADCIRRYSQARVLAPSKKKFITGYELHADGKPVLVDGKPVPKFSRELTAADVRESLVRKFN